MFNLFSSLRANFARLPLFISKSNGYVCHNEEERPCFNAKKVIVPAFSIILSDDSFVTPGMSVSVRFPILGLQIFGIDIFLSNKA